VRTAVPAAWLAAALAALGYVALVDPNEPGHYPVCLLHRFTGWWCPGCGGLRSAHALAHGDLPAALTDNALAVGAAAVAAVLWIARTVRALRPPGVRRAAPGRLVRAVPWACAALTAAFTVVRNLPCGAWLHP
jgi:hypothetical protein